MSLWSYDVIVVPAVLGGFLLVGLYGDVVVGAAIVGIARFVEAAARLVSETAGRVRPAKRPQGGRLTERRAARA